MAKNNKEKKNKIIVAPMAHFTFKHGVPEKVHASMSVKIPTVPYANVEVNAGISSTIIPGANPGEALEECFIFVAGAVKQKKEAIVNKLKENGIEVQDG